MSNVIKIKHGRTEPTSEGILSPFELGCYQPEGEDGYAHLYIGNVNGIGVPIKPIGGLAEGLANSSGQPYNVGSGTTPIYFANGIPVACSADVTIGLTAEKADSLSTARTFTANLASSTAGSFDGSADVELGVTGILSVSKGGTGRASLTKGRVLVGNGTDQVQYKTIDTTVTVSSANLITSGAVHTFCSNGYLPISGGALTGALTLKGNVYGSNYTSGALNANNSDIYGINGLWFSDKVDSNTEGINFYNSATTTDTLMAIDGKLRFAPARPLNDFRSGYEVLHTGNHITLLGSELDLTGSTAQTITASDIGDYSAYLFTAHSNGTGSKDGYMTLIVPRDLITSTASVFFVAMQTDGKYFSVAISDTTMTLKNVGYAGNSSYI